MTFVIVWNKANSGYHLNLTKALWQLVLGKLVVQFMPYTAFDNMVKAWTSTLFPQLNPLQESVYTWGHSTTQDDIYEDWRLR